VSGESSADGAARRGDRPDPGEQGDEKADDEGDRRRLDDEGHAGGQTDAAHEHEHEEGRLRAEDAGGDQRGIGRDGHTERSTSVE
jgi:major membrane immunogen (membrane-anchored lipoprotein)